MSYEARCILAMLKALVEQENVDKAAVIRLALAVAEGKHLVPR